MLKVVELQALCNKITQETSQELKRNKLDCEANLANAVANYVVGKKYVRVDVGGSGKYMIDKENNAIYGIKAYGVIHKGHQYGTLDTIEDYFWGGYTAIQKRGL